MSPLYWRLAAIAAATFVGAGALLGARFSQAFVVVNVVVMVAMILWGVRHHRPGRVGPWLMYCGTALCFGVSNVLRFFPIGLVDGPGGDPTFAELFDFLGFVLAGLATHRLGEAKDRDKDPTTYVDALILTGGISAIVWITTTLPYIQDGQLSSTTRIIGVAMSSVTLWLVFAIARYGLTPGVRNTPIIVMSAAAIFALLSKTMDQAGFGVLGIGTTAFGSCALLCVGLAGLHPQMVHVTEATERGIAKLTMKRLVLMAAAVLTAPAIIFARMTAERMDVGFTAGLIVSWVVVTSLVVVRLGGLVRARENVADIERATAAAAAALVSATDRDATYKAAMQGVAAITGGFALSTQRISVAVRDGDEWRIACSSGADAASASGHVLDSALMDSLITSQSMSVLQLRDTVAVDLPTLVRCSLVMAPLVSQGRVRGALLVSAGITLPTIVVDALGTFATHVSLAIDANALSDALHRERSERRFKSIVESSKDAIFVLDAAGDVTFMSPAGERTVGKGVTSLKGLLATVHEQDQAAVVAWMERARAAGEAPAVQFRLDVTDGERIYEASVTDLYSDPEVNGLVFTARDITERLAAEADRDRVDARFRSLAQHSSDLTAIVDEQGMLTYVSPSSESILGYGSEIMTGRPVLSLFDKNESAAVSEILALFNRGVTGSKSLEVAASTASGSTKTLDVTFTNLHDDPSVAGTVLNARDITDRKALEGDLRNKVLSDHLTGLANRVRFRDRVDHALQARFATSEDGGPAVLFIGVDNFKNVNDALGHDAGDELLRVVAFRLENFLRAGDTAARLGNDEFAVLLESSLSPDDVLSTCERLAWAVAQPVTVGDREIDLTISVGVALATAGAETEVLLRSADVALYHAKQSGKNCVKFFDQAMHAGALDRLELKSDLVHALGRQELELHYQPLIDMRTGKAVAFEALLRWQHPTRGMVSPVDFIPLAEETGLIVPIGAWVLEEACRQTVEWQKVHGPELGISVNLAPRQLEDEHVVEMVRQVFVHTGIDPTRVTLEVTETSGLDSPELIGRLDRIRGLGCGLAADDFGTGFASYAALQVLPFTNLKIDRSLIKGLAGNDPRAEAQVTSIVQMGKGLGLSITAEGIEDARQAATLTRLGADKGQGYHFGRPVNAGKAARVLGDARSRK